MTPEHSLRDPSSPTRNQTRALAVKVPSPNNQTTREFPVLTVNINTYLWPMLLKSLWPSPPNPFPKCISYNFFLKLACWKGKWKVNLRVVSRTWQGSVLYSSSSQTPRVGKEVSSSLPSKELGLCDQVQTAKLLSLNSPLVK